MSDLTDLQEHTKDRRDFVDFSNQHDILLMGKEMLLTKLDHSWGFPIPTIYYDDGIEQFDKLLEDKKDFELNVSFHMACYLNALK